MQPPGQTGCRHATDINISVQSTEYREWEGEGEGNGTYQITGDYRIDTFGLQHHSGSHSVHQHLIDLDLRKLPSDLNSDFIPEHHAIALRITLRHHGQVLARSFGSSLKRKPHNTLNSMARENRRLCSYFPWESTVRTSSLSGIFPLTVLPYNHPVQVAGGAVSERRLCTA